MGRTIGVDAESCINAIATSKDKCRVAAAGRKVFTIYNVDEVGFSKHMNLRVRHMNLNYSCNDVVWHPLKDELLATGATNGTVVTWNLGKSSGNKMEHTYTDNKRTVNKVCFHPSEWYILMSGSGEGCVKIFDLRQQCAVAGFKDSEAVSIRDIQFKPHDLFLFGAASDNGCVQFWDYRRLDRLLLKEPVHTEIVFSLDWHPEEKHWFATCGRDKTIKVWHWESHEYRLHADYTLHHIQSVRKVKWRPGKKYHIASCSQVDDNAISVWDIRRPYVPFAVFEEHKDTPTGIEWLEPHVFLTSGKDNMIFQHVFKDAKKPAETSNPVGVAVSLHGDVFQSIRAEPHKANFSRTLSAQDQSSRPKGVPPMWFRRSEKCQEVTTSFESKLIFHELRQDRFADWFCKTAKGYKLTGLSFQELCEYNAGVAENLGRYQIAQTWKMLGLLFMDTSLAAQPVYGKQTSSSTDASTSKLPADAADKAVDASVREPLSNQTSVQEASHTVDSTTGVTDEESAVSDSEFDHGGHQCFKRRHKMNNGGGAEDLFLVDVGDDEGDLSEDEIMGMINDTKYTLPIEAFSLRHDIQYSFRPPSPDNLHDRSRPDSPAVPAMDIEPDSSRLTGRQILNSHAIDQALTNLYVENQLSTKIMPLIKEMLEHYANEGDVQMSVSSYIVLGDKMKGEIPDEQLEQWFTSYIELLSRFKLWCKANEIIKCCELPNIQILNQQSTTVYVTCNQCEKPLEKQSWACSRARCGLTNPCSVCHLPVKGLYSWCQGCSHGGHMPHLQEWFSHSRYCPTGCGHQCEYR